MKSLPVCEFGTRKPHETRDCSYPRSATKIKKEKCRYLIDTDSCPKDHIKLRTKDVKRPKIHTVFSPDEFKETVKKADKGDMIIFDEVGKSTKEETLSDLETLFDKEEDPKDDSDIGTMFNGQEYVLPDFTTPEEITASPKPKKTTKKKCDLCGIVSVVACAQRICPQCGKKSLRSVDPKTWITKQNIKMRESTKIIETPLPVLDPNLMPCGHYVKEYELQINNDMEYPGMVFYRNICMEGHRSEWMFIGHTPLPSDCSIDEEF